MRILLMDDVTVEWSWLKVLRFAYALNSKNELVDRFAFLIRENENHKIKFYCKEYNVNGFFNHFPVMLVIK